ncbi:MAG: hypothetical protein NTY53_12320 [Kiritimatiellaeota bacterium]|nr:hypothetical protein [Kiritimatiellota bacterium]
MKKVLWMLVAVAMLGLSAVAKDAAAAGGDKAKGTHKPPVTVSGTVKVDGDKICIKTDDGAMYTVKSKDEKVLADLKAKDGQKTELKGMVKEEGDAKTLFVFGGHGGGHGKKKDAPAEQK